MALLNRLAGDVAALALSISMVAGAEAGGLKDGPPPPPAAKKWLPWVEGGGYLSTEQHRGELNLFAPLWQSSVALMFFQGTGRVFEDDIEEGNFALGFRQMTGSGWNIGLWAGYDVRNTEIDNTFHQVSFGFEALSDRWDIRANGYVALSDPEASPGLAQVALFGNGIFMIGGEEVPLSGFDGEVGYKLFGSRGNGGGWKDGPAHGGRSHELRVYAGGYYFDDGDALDEIAGARARLEWRIDDVIAALPGSRLTFEGEYQYDDVREEQWEGGVRLRVPFGSGSKQTYAAHLASLTPQERRMTERVERDVDIVTTVSKEESVFDTLTGVRFDRAAVVQGGGDLQGALNANGPNSLVILDGGVTNGSFAVGPSQTLQGGASTIQVTGVRSGTTAGFTAPGSKPFIVQTLNQAVVTVDSDTHLAGLGIQGDLGAGADNNGIAAAADGVSNVAITDTMLMDLGRNGIAFGNNHNKILISGTSIQSAATLGIAFGDNNSNVTIANTVVDTVGASGILFSNANSDVTLKTVSVRNAGLDGIVFLNENSAVTLKNVTVDTAAINGIAFVNNNSDVTISKTNVANVGFDGISFTTGNSNIAISDTSIANAGSDGIALQNNNADITISSTSIANTNNHGIGFQSGNSNVTLSGNTVTNVASNGISFFNDNSDVTVTGNSVSNVSGDGIFFNGGNSVTITGNTLTDITFDGIDVGGAGAPNVLTVTNNTFAGNIGDDVIEFDGQVDTLLDGSGNQLAPGAIVGGSTCELELAGDFVGTLQIGAFTFVDGAGC
ncbi:MAG: right-handed parallel beta-helix repeat-containing protein [Hyphomicrobiales bacterium]|nr:right-handed parallel beta-helix repeat-containing protein [Hyphomicrobiales bacterium]